MTRNPVETPRWLLLGLNEPPPLDCNGRRRAGASEKTLKGLAGLVKQALSSEQIAARPGLLQRLDARAKLVGILVLLVMTGLAKHLSVIGGLYLLVLALAAASRVGLCSFVKRVWLFVPLFSGLVVAPAMFNFVTPGEVVLPLGRWLGHEIGLTRQGLVAAGLVVGRVAVSISLVTLLTLTTPWPRLLSALRAVFVPRLLVVVLGMAFRYLFVLAQTIEEMIVARKARTIPIETTSRARRSLIGSFGGALFAKSHVLSEEVYQAMLARGYRGGVRTLDQPRLRAADGAWILFCAGLVVLILGGDRALVV